MIFDLGLPKKDPCLNKQCHPGAICETWNDAEKTKVAVCTCLSLSDLQVSGRCQLQMGELCASNGNMYPSTCHMLLDACLQQTELNIVSWTAVNQEDCRQQAGKSCADLEKFKNDYLCRLIYSDSPSGSKNFCSFKHTVLIYFKYHKFF